MVCHDSPHHDFPPEPGERIRVGALSQVFYEAESERDRAAWLIHEAGGYADRYNGGFNVSTLWPGKQVGHWMSAAEVIAQFEHWKPELVQAHPDARRGQPVSQREADHQAFLQTSVLPSTHPFYCFGAGCCDGTHSGDPEVDAAVAEIEQSQPAEEAAAEPGPAMSDTGTTAFHPDGSVTHTHAYDEYGQCPCGAWQQNADALGTAAPRDAEGGYLCCPGQTGENHDAQCENFVDDGSEAGAYTVAFYRGDEELETRQFLAYNQDEAEYLLDPYGRLLGATDTLVSFARADGWTWDRLSISIEPAGEAADA